MSLGTLSYRNGKYQGFLNTSQQRHGLGILVDDDLTFHVSNWHQDKMQGPTLVYLAHAKYIYGQWKNNQPHGINVYRSGDTVLLSKYVFGVPTNRCLLIFQRHSLACVLGENNKQWQMIKSGMIVNHTSLMNYIQLLQIDVPDHYLSLIKFACAFSNHNNAIKTFPCHQDYCYFGYINGLAIVFNNNNGLVTVGWHKNEELSEFGGKFHSQKYIQQGDFSAGGERIDYRGERPTVKVYQIYQKLHKKDMNFKNQLYDSKVKIFNSIHSLIINKFKHIVEDSKKSELPKKIDLNDSLSYHEQEEEQLYQLRERMYSPPKKVFEKTNHTPRKIEASPLPKSSLFSQSIKKPIMEQKVTRTNEKGRQKGKSTLKSNLITTNNKKTKMQNKFPTEDNDMGLPILHQDTNWSVNPLQETSSFKQILQKEQSSNPKLKPEGKPQEKSLHRRQRSIENFARPKYEDIQQRRKRILRDLQQINNESPITNKPVKRPVQDSPRQQNVPQVEKEDSSFGFIPLSLSNKVNSRKKSIAQNQAQVQQQQQNRNLPQKSPSRKVNYNYSNLDSSVLGQKNELLGSQQSNISPSRPKRTYKYMYE